MSTIPTSSTQGGDELVHGLTAAEVEVLGTKCLEARAGAYCPYSLFRVGASLLLKASPQTIITGANVENASYPVGTCAERVALGTAIHAGHLRGSFKAIGVATDMDDFCSPCGMCRQFMREFLEDDCPVFMFNKVGEVKIMSMGELLPMSFGPEALPSREVLMERGEEGKAKKA